MFSYNMTLTQLLKLAKLVRSHKFYTYPSYFEF